MAIPINPISPRYIRTDADMPDELGLAEENDWLTVRWKSQNGDSQD